MNDHLRIPPASAEAEQAVLGSLMIAPEKLAALQLSDTDFYSSTHAEIFRAIRDSAEQSRAFDAVTLGERFPEHNAALIEYARYAVPASIGTHAEIIREHAIKRSVIEVGSNLVNQGFNGTGSTEAISEGMAGLAQLSARSSDEHTEPLDLFCDQPFPVLDQEWLPPGIGRYAFDVAEIMGTAPELMAFACLGTAAAAIHDDIVVKVKPNEWWTERACLWLMLIAPPGSKKSASMKEPMKPLRLLNHVMSGEFAVQHAEYTREMKTHALRERAAIKREAEGTSGMDEPLRAPERPPQQRIIVSDVTTEKLGELLVDNPRGLLYYVDELTLWFGSHDAYAKGLGGRDRAYALQAYDGGPTDMDRIGRGTVSIPNFSYSLMGTTQPDKIKALLSKMTDDGLMQRFCTIETPARSRPGVEDRDPDPATVAAYENTIRGLWALKPAQGRTVVTFSPEADTIRRSFFDWVNRVASTDGLPAMLRGHLSKWEGLFPRLCLVYHCYGATSASLWPGNVPISAVTAGRVRSLMQRFLLPQALRFYTETVSAADPVYSIAKKVAGMVLATGSLRLTNRELQRGVSAWRTAQDWQKNSVIGMLRESGWLTGTDTRRTTGADAGWSVNPKVHTLFAQRAAEERLRRAEGVETLRELRDAAAGR